MSLIRLFIFLLLLATALMQGCASAGTTTGVADCQGLSGSYRNESESDGDSLMYFLLKKKSMGRLVQLEVSAQEIRISSGTRISMLAAEKDFHCAGTGRIMLTRQESSRIRLPPLIDQVKIVSYELTGGAGVDLALTRYAQTTLAPYGVELKGPMQVESTTTWHRTGP